MPKTFNGYTITREAFVRGGSGVVHDAVDSQGRRVAIKVLDRTALEKKLSAAISEEIHDPAEITEKTGIAYEKNIERFKEEYRNLTGLNHPNVAKVYELGFREGSFFIVYEYVDGKPIAEYVRLWKAADMIPIFIEALHGLDYIHRNGLLHLDIKSENILVREVNGKPEVKIIDFGLSMAPSEYEGGFLGSVNYMAPEIVLGLKDQVDARADLFSFGVLMYFCITWVSHPYARPPKASRELMCRVVKREPTFKHDPPSYAHLSRPGYVPEFLDTIVMRLVEHDPKDRFYTNARAVINALATHAPDAFAEGLETKGSYLRPIGDRHIGNESEQVKVYTAIDALASGKTPSPAVVEITGEQGTGKSHLLKKIKEHAEKYADKLTIKKIELPADEVALKQFSDDVTLWASENKLPVVILVDGMGTFPSLAGLFRMITSRESNPALYSGQQPILVAFTSSLNTPSPLVTADGGIAPKALMGEGWGEGKHYLNIPLSPFTPADLKAYLASTPAFADKKAPDEFVSRLHAATKGIQAEVGAHLCELDSDGMLFNLDGEILVSDLKRHEKPPATTEARLQKTYDGLLPEERRILDFLSVWGLKQITPPPDFETISHLVASPLVALRLNNLSSVIARSVPTVIAGSPKGDEAIPSDPAYSFINPYFSIFIYNRLDADEKIRWHDSVARYLSSVIARSPKGDEAISSSILLHQGFGSNKTLAIKSLVKLAKTTLYDKGRADLAAWLIEHAISTSQPDKLKLRIYLDCLLAEALFYEGKLDKVERILNKNLVDVSKIGASKTHLETLIQVWHALNLSQQKKYDEAATVLEECLGRYDRIGVSAFYPRLLNLKAWNLYRQSFTNHQEATAILEKSAAIYQSSRLYEKKLPAQMIRRINTNNLGIVLRVLGKPSDAAIELENNLSKRNHTIFSKLVSLIAITETYRMLGEYEKAKQYGKAALNIAASSGLGEWLMHTHWTLSNLYHDMDHFDESIEEGRRYLALSCCIEDKQSHNQTLIYSWVHMGHCYKEKKDWDNAILHFEAAIDGNAKGQHLMSAYLGMGEVFFNTGKSEKALDYLSRAMGVMKDLPKNAITASHEKRIKEIMEKINCTLKSRSPA